MDTLKKTFEQNADTYSDPQEFIHESLILVYSILRYWKRYGIEAIMSIYFESAQLTKQIYTEEEIDKEPQEATKTFLDLHAYFIKSRQEAQNE